MTAAEAIQALREWDMLGPGGTEDARWALELIDIIEAELANAQRKGLRSPCQ